MSALITCPKCNNQFEPTEALEKSIKEDLKKEYNLRWADMKRQQEEEFKQREQQLLAQQKEQARRKEEEQRAAVAQAEKNIKSEMENQLKMLEDNNRKKDASLAEARNKELEFLKKMQDLATREQELELQIQRKLMEERAKLGDILRKEEDEKNKLKEEEFQMKLREKDKQLEDQRKLVDEMKRKAEQGSMQMQGEVQELALEQLLQSSFPFDIIKEVGKGVRGADCIQTVRNSFGQECGNIIFESKRTKDFSEEWIEKLKADMRSQGSDLAVLVTQAMPRDMETFGERKGVWVCSFSEVRALVYVLREWVIKVYTATKSQENRGDKMTLLYNYLVSNEFAEQWRAMREGFMNMKMSIQRERDQMEKLWKAREKELEKVLLNAAHVRGSIEGIAGMDVDLNLLPEG